MGIFIATAIGRTTPAGRHRGPSRKEHHNACSGSPRTKATGHHRDRHAGAGEGEILLKVGANTVCGTDLRILRGEKTAGVRPGVVLGHEIAGTIAALGKGVAGYRVGDAAVVTPAVTGNVLLLPARQGAALRQHRHLRIQHRRWPGRVLASSRSAPWTASTSRWRRPARR